PPKDAVPSPADGTTARSGSPGQVCAAFDFQKIYAPNRPAKSNQSLPEEMPLFQTTPGFGRIGEENAFAVLARATELAQQGRDIINLGIGQPDFRTPDHIVEAA